MLPIVCFIACHGASADHFATFTKHANAEQMQIRIYASDDMAKKFEDKKITIHSRFALNDPQTAERIAKECVIACVVITDVGHRFCGDIQRQLAEYAPKTVRLAYYDNPEIYVPGGYSATAKEVLQAANGVLFANATLADATLFLDINTPVDLTKQKKIGLGYYPLEQAGIVAKRRKEEKAAVRKELFVKHDLQDKGQKLIVYFGGNNEEYFTKAFPAFLEAISKPPKDSDLIFILQQHPAAKVKNRDAALVASWQLAHETPKILISDSASDVAQIVADGALYYQTSMGPQFVLAGIPTAQIGHERYEDVLIRNNLIESITTYEEIEALAAAEQAIPKELLLQGLGINTNWPDILSEVLLGLPEELSN